MRTNSIISDATPPSFDIPQPPEITETDWQKVANSKKYPEIMEYMNTRKEYYRRYLPDGRPVENVSSEERQAHWNTATIVIKEIEALQSQLILNKKK